MNDTPVFGWYYRSIDNRAPAWTGVEFFARFLLDNAQLGVGLGVGPFAEETELENLQLGDFVQLGRQTGDFYHTPVVVGFSQGVPLVAAHSYDAFAKPLTNYSFARLRCLHILGVKHRTHLLKLHLHIRQMRFRANQVPTRFLFDIHYPLLQNFS